METIIGTGGPVGGPNGEQPPADLIKDSDTARFAQDVIEAWMTSWSKRAVSLSLIKSACGCSPFGPPTGPPVPMMVSIDRVRPWLSR